MVYPSFHEDIKDVDAAAQRAKKLKAEMKERAKKRRDAKFQHWRRYHGYHSDDSYDNPYNCYSDEDSYTDDSDEEGIDYTAMNMQTWIRPCSIPLIFPAHSSLKVGTWYTSSCPVGSTAQLVSCLSNLATAQRSNPCYRCNPLLASTLKHSFPFADDVRTWCCERST